MTLFGEKRNKLYKSKFSDKQWYSQDTTNARAKHRHTSFVRTSVENAEAQIGGIWDVLLTS